MKLPKPQQLPSGAWRIHVQVNGKRVAKTFPTESEALYWAAGIKTEEKQYKESPRVLLLGDAYDRYISMKDGVLSVTTIAGYKRMRNTTFPNIMGKDINALTNEMVQLEISRMAKEGKSPKYIRNAHGLLSSVLKSFRPDFVLRVTLPQKDIKEQRALTFDELQQILDITRGTDIELPILMASWLGMRMSEILGAQYEDIKEHRLHVCRALVLDETGRYVEKNTKTRAGDRYIPLPSYIEQRIGEGSGRIVNLRGEYIYKHLVKMMRENNMEPCRFHDLRHANAAVMIHLGIDARYAQERNGWESEYMYKQVYGYTVKDHLDMVSAQIDSFFLETMIDKSAHENAHEK